MAQETADELRARYMELSSKIANERMEMHDVEAVILRKDNKIAIARNTGKPDKTDDELDGLHKKRQERRAAVVKASAELDEVVKKLRAT